MHLANASRGLRAGDRVRETHRDRPAGWGQPDRQRSFLRSAAAAREFWHKSGEGSTPIILGVTVGLDPQAPATENDENPPVDRMAIGCRGDGSRDSTVTRIDVVPNSQGRRIGRGMMQSITQEGFVMTYDQFQAIIDEIRRRQGTDQPLVQVVVGAYVVRGRVARGTAGAATPNRPRGPRPRTAGADARPRFIRPDRQHSRGWALGESRAWAFRP